VQQDPRQVFDDLVRFETMLWNQIDATLRRDAGISLGSFNMLAAIAQTPDCRVYDIATALAITVGGASQAVDRLEKAGLCERTANPSDRRSSIVALTVEGRARTMQAGPVFDAELERLLVKPASRDAFDQLGATLAILRRAAATAVSSDPGEANAATTRRTAPQATSRHATRKSGVS
jgi:DNA-binding MarR family transcriptional regulator